MSGRWATRRGRSWRDFRSVVGADAGGGWGVGNGQGRERGTGGGARKGETGETGENNALDFIRTAQYEPIICTSYEQRIPTPTLSDNGRCISRSRCHICGVHMSPERSSGKTVAVYWLGKKHGCFALQAHALKDPPESLRRLVKKTCVDEFLGDTPKEAAPKKKRG